MINSRKIEDLLPHIQQKAMRFLALAKENGIELLVHSTYRDNASQDALYAQGRTKPGEIATKAMGGYSYHNYRRAFDVVPIVAGKAEWNNSALWKKIGKLGKSLGLEWGGDFKSFRDYGHFQVSDGLKIADLLKGEK